MIPVRPTTALAMALAVPLGAAIHAPAFADSYVAGGEALGDFGADVHKAVQEALRSKGYYSGPVDGNFGPMSRRAVLKFRADHHISRSGRNGLKLDKPLVAALFGIQDFAVKTWDDQFCFLEKVAPPQAAAEPGTDTSSMCDLDQEESPAGRDEAADPGNG